MLFSSLICEQKLGRVHGHEFIGVGVKKTCNEGTLDCALFTKFRYGKACIGKLGSPSLQT
jgi:hypothetical protein